MNVAGVHAYIPYTRAYKVARMLPEEYALYDAKEAVRRETRAYEQRVQEAQRAHKHLGPPPVVLPVLIARRQGRWEAVVREDRHGQVS